MRYQAITRSVTSPNTLGARKVKFSLCQFCLSCLLPESMFQRSEEISKYGKQCLSGTLLALTAELSSLGKIQCQNRRTVRYCTGRDSNRTRLSLSRGKKTECIRMSKSLQAIKGFWCGASRNNTARA